LSTFKLELSKNFFINVFIGILIGTVALEIYALTESELQTEEGLKKIDQTRSRGVPGFFVSKKKGLSGQQVNISYFSISSKDQNPKSPAIVIFPGYSEPWLKYDELVHDLSNRGFQLFLMDHRGMGLSTHLVDRLAHVSSIDDYGEDALQFLEEIVFPRAQGPIHLLGHSLGGLVVTNTIPRLTQPERIHSIGLNAPLFEIESGSIPYQLVSFVVFLQNFLGFGDDIMWGRGRYDPKKDRAAQCSTTFSAVRCQRAIDLLRNREELLIQAPTAAWVKAVLEATSERERIIKALGKHPVLITQAGIDYYVRPKPQEEICSQLPKCRLEKFVEAKHELLHEKDSTRDRVIGTFADFFKKYSTAGMPSDL
jgi:lysophospholipase